MVFRRRVLMLDRACVHNSWLGGQSADVFDVFECLWSVFGVSLERLWRVSLASLGAAAVGRPLAGEAALPWGTS